MNFDLGSLWRRKFTLIAFTLLGIGAGYAYIKFVPATFEAQARVLIEPQGLSPDDEEAGRVVPEFIPTQAETLRSPITISEAVKKIDIVKPAGADPSKFDPVQHVLKSLVVTPVLNANVVTVAYRSNSQRESTELISEIVDAYREHINQIDQSTSVTNIQLFDNREKNLRQELRELEKEHEDLRKRSPLIGQGREGNADAMAELDLLTRELSTINSERSELEARLRTILTTDPGQSENLTGNDPPEQERDLTEIPVDTFFRLEVSTPVPSQPVPSQPVPSKPVPSKPTTNPESPSNRSRALKPPTAGFDGKTNPVAIDPAKIEQIIRYADPIDARDIQTLEQNLRFANLQVKKLDQVYGDLHPDLIGAKAEVEQYQMLLKNRLANAVRSWQKQLAILRQKVKEVSTKQANEKQRIKDTEVFLLQEENLVRNIDNLQRLHNSALEQLLTLQSDEMAISKGRNSIDVRILDGPLIIDDLTWPNPKLLLAGSACIGFLIGFVVIAIQQAPAIGSDSRIASSSNSNSTTQETASRQSGSEESPEPDAAQPQS